jgi:pimeloyl-ACP methyl ester carboxylesterase
MSQRRLRLLIAIPLAVALVAGATTMTAGATGELGLDAPRRCDGAVRAPESENASRAATAVLFVHGFTGSPGDFRRTRDGQPSMVESVARMPGVAAYTFDYSAASTQWVTNLAIGPALAKAIVCLAARTGKRIVVVAHSMGGLATRFAQGVVIDGQPVANSVQRVVTIGTPTEGVILLSFTQDDVAQTIVQALVDAASEACGKKTRKEHLRLCELLDAANAPAVSAMAPGSADLRRLPPWNSRLAIAPIAADLRLRVSVLGLGTTLSLGDIVATVDSATADASRGERAYVARCKITLEDLFEVVDRSPCSHTNELTNLAIGRAVRAQVRVATGTSKDQTKRSASR